MALIQSFFLFLLLCVPSFTYSNLESNKVQNWINIPYKKTETLSYYFYINDFINSFIGIPTSNITVDSSTINSTYLAGNASIYNMLGTPVGTCSASFLCIQNNSGIFTSNSNYLSINNGLILSWLMPNTLTNLELNTIVQSMVGQNIVVSSAMIGTNPFYGKKFNINISSDGTKITFILTRVG